MPQGRWPKGTPGGRGGEFAPAGRSTSALDPGAKAGRVYSAREVADHVAALSPRSAKGFWHEQIASYSASWRVVQVPLDKVGLKATQGRGVETALYRAQRDRGSQFPAVLLRRPFPAGSLGNKWLIWDGTHRVRAALERGDKTIAAFVPVKK